MEKLFSINVEGLLDKYIDKVESMMEKDQSVTRTVVVDCDGVKNYDFIKNLNKSDLVILVGDSKSEINACAMMSLVSVGCKLDYRELAISSRYKCEYIMFLLGQLSNKENLMLVTENCVLNGIVRDLSEHITLVNHVKSKNEFDNDLCDGFDDLDSNGVTEVDVPNIDSWKKNRMYLDTVRDEEYYKVSSNKSTGSVCDNGSLV